jgi:uncharacterized protein with GYD domain
MAKYIALASWTEQGVKNIKESPSRVDAARALAKKHGCTMGDFYMTIGAADMMVIVDAPNDEAMAKFALSLAIGGNIRTTTMKAFTETEYRNVIAGL